MHLKLVHKSVNLQQLTNMATFIKIIIAKRKDGALDMFLKICPSCKKPITHLPINELDLLNVSSWFKKRWFKYRCGCSYTCGLSASDSTSEWMGLIKHDYVYAMHQKKEHVYKIVAHLKASKLSPTCLVLVPTDTSGKFYQYSLKMKDTSSWHDRVECLELLAFEIYAASEPTDPSLKQYGTPYGFSISPLFVSLEFPDFNQTTASVLRDFNHPALDKT